MVADILRGSLKCPVDLSGTGIPPGTPGSLILTPRIRSNKVVRMTAFTSNRINITKLTVRAWWFFGDCYLNFFAIDKSIFMKPCSTSEKPTATKLHTELSSCTLWSWWWLGLSDCNCRGQIILVIIIQELPPLPPLDCGF